MADGDPLPPNDHGVHYCKPSQVDKGQVLAPAFMLEGTHEELSLTWLECLGNAPRLDQLRAAREAMLSSLFRPKPNGWFATIQVQAITSLTSVAGQALDLRVTHCPVVGNDCHGGVYGLPSRDSELARAVGIELARRIDGSPVLVRNVVTPFPA